MKKSIFFIFFIIFLGKIFPETWEFGMQVLNSEGDPIQLSIFLYQSEDILNIFRSASSYNGWDPDYPTVNFVCDVGDNNTPGAYWDPIDPGTYRLRIFDRYIELNINEIPISSGDFVIKYQDDEFTLVYNNRGVTISETRDWDYPVVFQQKKEDGTTDVGTVAIWNGSSFNERYSPPHEYDLIPGIYFFDADTNVHDSQKFHKYSNDLGYINYLFEGIDYDSYLSTIQANFKSVSSSVYIQNQAEGITPVGGSIYFWDPWLNDLNEEPYGLRNRGTGAVSHSVDSPFNPNTNTSGDGHNYKGVFLNQSGPPSWNPPYYSVQAISPQQINMGGKYGTRTFYFEKWTGSGVQYQHSDEAATAVVFTSSDAAANAVMKGHLLSDKDNAFSSNAQRNLVRDVNGIYHLFYISMNKIWHTKSLTTNFNGAWSQEQVVPMDNSFDIPISISVDAANAPGPDSIAIAYCDGYSLGYTTLNASTGAVIDKHYVQTTIEDGYGNFVKPVVAYTKKELMVVYRAYSNGGLYCSIKYKSYDNNDWEYSEHNLLPNTNFTSINPTITVTKTGYVGDIFHIAFQDGNVHESIMYASLGVGTDFNSFRPENISTTSTYSNNYSPSISLFYIGNNEYRPIVSWTAQNAGTLGKILLGEGNEILEPRLICRPKNYNNTWGSCFAAGQYVNYSSNNSVISGGVNQSVIAWSQLDGTESKWVKRDGTEYSGYNCLEPPGLYPNLSTGNNFSSIRAFTTDATTFPSILNPVPADITGNPDCSGNQKVKTLYDLTYSRSGVILKKGIEFVFNTGDIVNSDTVIKFINVPDTLVYNSTGELNASLRTEVFSLNQHLGFSLHLKKKFYYSNTK